MREFLKRVPAQVASTYTIMLITFTVISSAIGVELMPVSRLAELFLLAVIGGVLIEFAFGQYVFKKMSDMKRTCIFMVPFAIITFLVAVAFRWITQLDVLETYLKFIGIFVVCWGISVLLFEIEHRIRGKQYTQKLKEYQTRKQKDE